MVDPLEKILWTPMVELKTKREMCFFAVGASCYCLLLGHTRSQGRFEQPFDCLIIQNHQAVQSMRR